MVKLFPSRNQSMLHFEVDLLLNVSWALNYAIIPEGNIIDKISQEI